MDDFAPFKSQHGDAELVIIMMFGGDNNLSHFVYQDLQEMAAGIKGNIAVIGLADLANAPAAVVEVGSGTGIQTIEEWGEIDTGDPDILMKFVARALKTYPKARKAIGFWDHGTGVFDETDASEKLLTPSGNLTRTFSVVRENRTRSYPARHLFFPRAKLAEDDVTRGMLHDDTSGGILTNLEAGKMLAAAFDRAGQSGKIDLIFSDTCLNGMIEVLDELGPYAECVVASSELEPGDGWDYQLWLSQLSAKLPTSPFEWGHNAVDAFYKCYEPHPKKYPCTLGAFRSAHGMTEAFTALLKAAAGDSGHEAFFYLDHARSKAQGFAKRDTFDLKSFAIKVVDISEAKPALASAARNLVAACDAAKVHACCLGRTVTDSHGIAFWFPNSRSALDRDIKTYERLSFNTKSGWAEFLKEYR